MAGELLEKLGVVFIPPYDHLAVAVELLSEYIYLALYVDIRPQVHQFLVYLPASPTEYLSSLSVKFLIILPLYYISSGRLLD